MTAVAPRLMLYPVLALALLTFVVGLVMYRRRIAEIRAKRLRLQALATSTGAAASLEDTRAADNFRNLFEMPVLFYAAALVAYATQAATAAHVALAWAYVLARVAHSGIQCTSNRVRHRFLAFVASYWLLAALWALVAFDLLVTGKG